MSSYFPARRGDGFSVAAPPNIASSQHDNSNDAFPSTAAAVTRFPAVRSVLWIRDSNERSQLALGWRATVPEVLLLRSTLSTLTRQFAVRLAASSGVMPDAAVVMLAGSLSPSNVLSILHVPEAQIDTARLFRIAVSAASDHGQEQRRPHHPAAPSTPAPAALDIALSFATDTATDPASDSYGARTSTVGLRLRLPASTLRIRPLLLPPQLADTPLNHALLGGPMAALGTAVEGAQAGPLTLDAARRVVLLAPQDPTAFTQPIVGFWLRLGAEQQEEGQGQAPPLLQAAASGLPAWALAAVRHASFRTAWVWADGPQFRDRVRMPGAATTQLAVLLPPLPARGHLQQDQDQPGPVVVEAELTWSKAQEALGASAAATLGGASSAVAYSGLGPHALLNTDGMIHLTASCNMKVQPGRDTGWEPVQGSVATDTGRAVVTEEGHVAWALLPGTASSGALGRPTTSSAVGAGRQASSTAPSSAAAGPSLPSSSAASRRPSTGSQPQPFQSVATAGPAPEAAAAAAAAVPPSLADTVGRSSTLRSYLGSTLGRSGTLRSSGTLGGSTGPLGGSTGPASAAAGSRIPVPRSPVSPRKHRAERRGEEQSGAGAGAGRRWASGLGGHGREGEGKPAWDSSAHVGTAAASPPTGPGPDPAILLSSWRQLEAQALRTRMAAIEAGVARAPPTPPPQASLPPHEPADLPRGPSPSSLSQVTAIRQELQGLTDRLRGSTSIGSRRPSHSSGRIGQAASSSPASPHTFTGRLREAQEAREAAAAAGASPAQPTPAQAAAAMAARLEQMTSALQQTHAVPVATAATAPRLLGLLRQEAPSRMVGGTLGVSHSTAALSATIRSLRQGAGAAEEVGLGLGHAYGMGASGSAVGSRGPIRSQQHLQWAGSVAPAGSPYAGLASWRGDGAGAGAGAGHASASHPFSLRAETAPQAGHAGQGSGWGSSSVGSGGGGPLSMEAAVETAAALLRQPREPGASAAASRRASVLAIRAQAQAQAGAAHGQGAHTQH